MCNTNSIMYNKSNKIIICPCCGKEIELIDEFENDYINEGELIEQGFNIEFGVDLQNT